ncbi:pseudouridine synthase [Roseobacter sp. HKCCA0434]|uniref:pseudouridine synthase n=1 Tax=Roseobacter sp. HKCCA0434 TaxID=3079297 RepID=UPI002905DE4C|nr:pseudouridine synthase [Roseobacter sp. HKCCA0434]
MSKDTPEGERIAKRIARAGRASRREAERLIEGGRVRVNGRIIDSPALNVTDADRIEVDGQPLAEKEAPRLWRYYKPVGLVTSERDEKGRATVFDRLPPELPRVLSIGRLDLNSEGLLLLTNDGELKRRLELPSTGWTRKYRVRAKGQPTEETFRPLERGIVIEGERFRPMSVTLDRQQGANCWMTIALKEGKNREIRRALAEVGLEVNRLIRTSYGPFQLGEMEPGAVEEIKGKVLRDQLGLKSEPQAVQRAKRTAEAAARAGAKPGGKPGGRGPTGRPGPKPAGRGGKPAGDPSRSLRKKR